MKPLPTSRALLALLLAACAGKAAPSSSPAVDAGSVLPAGASCPTPPAKPPAHPPLDPGSVVRFGATTYWEGFDGGVQDPNGSNWWVNELPPHEVTLDAFSIDRTEVTAQAYATFLSWSGGLGHWSSLMPVVVGPTTADYAPVPDGGTLPASYVTWYDARAFCLWMGGDLPTEAQWEFAAKGAESRVYPWPPDGGGPSCEQAVFFTGDVDCADAPRPVGTHPLGDTPEGLHDMAGNVAEWVLDSYDGYPAAPQVNPVDEDGGRYGGAPKVVRGGGYRDLGISLRTTARWPADPDLRSPGVGFRCAYP